MVWLFIFFVTKRASKAVELCKRSGASTASNISDLIFARKVRESS
jgi:hypothetical protein